MHYGSEFRSPSILNILLKNHPKWEVFQDLLINGASYPASDIEESTQLSDIELHIERGNHKSATTEKGLATIQKAYKKEVQYGWQIPILPSLIKSIKGACVTPLGDVDQWTINEDNE